MAKVNDVIIIGAGAAGMTASIYCSRYKLKHLIFGEIIGGQFIESVGVENYPGFTSISGPDLAQAFKDQVESYGVRIRQEGGNEIREEGNLLVVKAEGGDSFKTQSLILAMGREHRHLNVPGEEEFTGKGVSYCATCDAPLFKGKKVAIVGGGNAAVAAAFHASAFAKRVYLIHRRNQYRADPIWVERMRTLKNVEEILSRQVREIQGDKTVKKVVLDKPHKGKKTLEVQGLIIETGREPVSKLAQMLGVKLDKRGSIKVNPDRSTNVPGVFAAGDIAQLPGGVPLNQIVNAAGEGAEAAAAAYEYLCQLEPCEREE